MSDQPLLHIDDLHVHFNTSDGVVQAINGASLTLNPGEIVGLVGESGTKCYSTGNLENRFHDFLSGNN